MRSKHINQQDNKMDWEYISSEEEIREGIKVFSHICRRIIVFFCCTSWRLCLREIRKRGDKK